MHDYDNNTKLDGLEIFKAITHLLDEEDGEAGLRGKSAEDIARLKREKELQNAGDFKFVRMCVCARRNGRGSERIPAI